MLFLDNPIGYVAFFFAEGYAYFYDLASVSFELERIVFTLDLAESFFRTFVKFQFNNVDKIRSIEEHVHSPE